MWRKLTKEDITRGTVIRMIGMIENGSYGMATIVSINGMSESYPTFIVARPYAYAHGEFDSNQPLLGVEVFGLDAKYAIEDGVEVFENRDGKVWSMAT